MRKTYIGCKIVNAEPFPNPDGKPGYRVYYPDGYTSWSPESTFVANYREVSNHERQVINQTDAEASIAAISDGDPAERCPNHNGGHLWKPRAEGGGEICHYCAIVRLTRTDPARFPDECPGSEDGRHNWQIREDRDLEQCRHCTATQPARG